jgi:hypothetical protein
MTWPLVSASGDIKSTIIKLLSVVQSSVIKLNFRLFYGTDYAGRWSDIICSGEGYTPFYFICEL